MRIDVPIDASIDASIHQAIAEAIVDIETRHGVRVLYAAESGSHAWGFASPDSDYDVRFVYAHALDRYLTLDDPRDVIEAMLPRDIDLAGWDLRKTLRLIAGGNPTPFEWLGSPIVYREDAAFAARLRERAPAFFRPAKALFHYLGTARSTWREHLCAPEVRLKKVFYALRPLLACRWIEHARTPPPTPFARLVEAPWVNEAERSMIAELQAAKALASEADRAPLSDNLAVWLVAQLEHYERVGPTLAARGDADTAPLDRLLREVIAPDQTTSSAIA